MIRKPAYQWVLFFIAVVWLISIINWLLNYQLNRYGIYPREVSGLIGIAFSPFLHGSFQHLLGNSITFLVLGWLVSLYGRKHLVRLTLFVMLGSGLCVWLLARQSYHIGLSGVIFGYWGFVVFNGFFEKSLRSIVISVATAVLYGGMIFGLLPLSASVSFESHIFGAFSGLIYSFLHRRKRKH